MALPPSSPARAASACGKPSLDDCLRRFAGQDERLDLTRCFVLVHRDEIGALLLGRFPIDRRAQRKGLGRRLLLPPTPRLGSRTRRPWTPSFRLFTPTLFTPPP